ncbi:MAG: sigma-70 family RNA polymerase sigma factor [candidate division WOR-3 bacterium]|nr:sigma-70 family RNA polymerase sigma factor [candidate division WOR-3 bacterium]
MTETNPKYLNDDKACVLRAINGEVSAYQVLYHRYKYRLFGFIRLRVDDKEDAQDILVRTLNKAFSNLNRIQNPKNFKQWLFKICLNEIRNYLRNQNTKIKVTSLENISESELINDPKDNPLTQSVHNTLQQLNPAELAIIDWRFFQQRSIAEIAELTGKKPEAIKYLLKKALKKFAHLYQSEYKLGPAKKEDEKNETV